jgi:muconolactone delta-isomerase
VNGRYKRRPPWGTFLKPKIKEEVNMPKKVFLTLVLIASLLSLIWLASSQSTASKNLTKANPSSTSSVPSKEAVSAKLATLERGWVKNEGQWDERALFSASGYFGNTWVTKDGELLHVAVKKEECKDKTEKAQTCPSKSWVISERWIGGKVQAIKGEEELQTEVSYFVGNDPSKHRSNLSTYRYVSLGQVWSGVEVKLKATQKTVEKLFYVKPGADPSKIVVQVDGAEGLKLSKDGEIIIKTGLGELKLSKPIAWQEKDGKKLPVEVSYKLIGKNRYSFMVAKADPSLPIVIDPILQSTYLGGSDDDVAVDLAIHPQTGEVYVAGYTNSKNFPKTTGGAQAVYGGGSYDAFVARLNKDLTQILQSTYLGGSSDDSASALAIHPQTGEVYVAGYTNSKNFPKTTGGAQAVYGGGSYDAFVARLNKDLTQILQSTYSGGSSDDNANALAIHPQAGEVYVAGYTNSKNFPKTTGGAQAVYGGGYYDAFVARLNKDLTQILQSTYLGGSSDDVARALAIHPQTGEVYVAGKTYSKNFPKTTGGAQAVYGGGSYDAFVARLNKDLTQILQSTYSGGSDMDDAIDLAIHPQTGEVYVAGYTNSKDFPKTTGGAQARKRAYTNPFVARLNKDLTQILQSTYLGGTGEDYATALAIHRKTGEIYVAGGTFSKNFPKTTGGAQAAHGGGDDDSFVARLNKELTQILQSTYLGGSSDDVASALAIHPQTGEIYVAGHTRSSNFPKTAGGAQTKCNECIATRGYVYGDAFVARLTADLAAGRSSGGGGGYYTTGSVSSMASAWNILLLLSFPAFVVARKIRRK